MRENTRPQELRRVLGVMLGIAIFVGGTIGVGMLRTPGIIAGSFGHPAVVLATSYPVYLRLWRRSHNSSREQEN